MTRQISTLTLLMSVAFIAGCQDAQKASQHDLYHEIKGQLVATCDGCDTRMSLYVDEEDIITARRPGYEEQMYLTIVDQQGRRKECCKKDMQMALDEQGKLYLKCPECGKMTPIAVKDGKVVVAE